MLLIFAACFFSPDAVCSQDYGVENIFDYGTGGRALGLGNSYVAIAEDCSSVYWNPAGLNLLKYKEVMLFHTSLFYGTLYNFAAFGFPTIDMGTLGFGVFRIGTGDIDYRDSDNILISEDNSFSKYQFLIGYGLDLGWPLLFGTALKINTHSMGQYTDANIAFDLSMLFIPSGPEWEKWYSGFSIDNLKIGINVKNIVSTPIKLEDYAETDELNVKTGVSYKYAVDAQANHVLLPTIDLNLYKDKGMKINSGMEYNLYKMGFIRMGYNQNIGPILGAGIEYWNIGLDYSLAFQEIDLTHRISMLWRFGRSIAELKEKRTETARKETEGKIQKAVEEQTAEYAKQLEELEERQKQMTDELEDKYKKETQRLVTELTQTYAQEREKIIDEMKQQSEEEKEKTIEELTDRYDQEKQEALSVLSNQYQEDKEELTEKLTSEYEAEIGSIRKKLIDESEFTREHFGKGVELFEKGDINGAIMEFQAVLKVNPKHKEAEKFLSRARASRKKATTYSEKIMKYYQEGIDYYIDGEYEKDIKEWQKNHKDEPYIKLAIRNINDAEKKLKKIRELEKSQKTKKKK